MGVPYHDPRGPKEFLGIFLVQAIIVLIVTRILGRVLKVAKQPAVIGQIIAGIVLGPSVLGQAPGWTENIFPKPTLTPFALVANVGKRLLVRLPAFGFCRGEW